jgi:hypothetical protein
MRTASRRATAILSFAANLLSVLGAVIAYNLVQPLPMWLGGPPAVVAIVEPPPTSHSKPRRHY